jgi:hypothetical protein
MSSFGWEICSKTVWSEVLVWFWIKLFKTIKLKFAFDAFKIISNLIKFHIYPTTVAALKLIPIIFRNVEI